MRKKRIWFESAMKRTRKRKRNYYFVVVVVVVDKSCMLWFALVEPMQLHWSTP